MTNTNCEGRSGSDRPSLLRVLSLGAGVQSTTLALMAAHGEIGPMPDCAIFADTGWEPPSVYEHLRWLSSHNVLPFPIHVVSNGNIRDGLIEAAAGRRWTSIPAYTRTVTTLGSTIPVHGEDGDGSVTVVEARRSTHGQIEIGMIRRQCTRDYKIAPIRRKVRELAGLTRKRSPVIPIMEQWIGISFDELLRMKPSQEPWQVNRWPLIERQMTRWDCLRWLDRHEYPRPPKSACIGCPYHSDAQWREIRDHDPDAWADAVEIDRTIRTGLRGIRGEAYLHRSCVPLDEVDLSTDEDRGQLNLFVNECEGMCGV